MAIISSGKIVLTQLKHGGLKTEHYDDLEDLIYGVLITNGVELFKNVVANVIPKAREGWKDELE